MSQGLFGWGLGAPVQVTTLTVSIEKGPQMGWVGRRMLHWRDGLLPRPGDMRQNSTLKELKVSQHVYGIWQ